MARRDDVDSQGPVSAPAPAPAPTPPTPPAAGAPRTLPTSDTVPVPQDQIGDIPPPPLPVPARARITGSGVAGIPGTEAGTFARPGTAAARPFQTPAFAANFRTRFGPGVPNVGGGSTDVSGLSPDMLSPEEAAELLRSLAGGGV